MNAVHVLVLLPVGGESLRRIAAVGSNVRVHDASKMFVFTDGAFVEQPDPSGERIDDLLAEAEIIYGFIPPKNVIARAPRLKWINAPSAGVDRFLAPEIVESRVILTNSRGIHPVQMGETVFEMLLMLAKKAPLFFRMKEERRWQRTTPGILLSKTLAILGLGVIGQEVARLGKAFGMRVIALEARDEERVDNVDALFAPAQLKEVLSMSDYVVVTLPLTPETARMIGDAELRVMKPTAHLVNVARGGIVDEEALIRALTEGWIAGAGLDVFAKEPLPKDSRLWELPNVIISPHIGGDREDYQQLAVDMFCKNLARYLDGQELFNVVDKKRGY
jgi:phosphoglycerate dehydrogenase-like enzyme